MRRPVFVPVFTPPSLGLRPVQDIDMKIGFGDAVLVPAEELVDPFEVRRGALRCHPQQVARPAGEQSAQGVDEPRIRRPQFAVVLQVTQQGGVDPGQPLDVPVKLLFPDWARGDIQALMVKFWGERTLRVVEVAPQSPAFVSAFVREALDHWTPYVDAWGALVYEDGVRAGRAWADDPAYRTLRDRARRPTGRGRSLLAIVRESPDLARTLSWQFRSLRHAVEAEDKPIPRALEDLPDDYLSQWVPPADASIGRRSVGLLKIEDPRLHLGFVDGFLGLRPELNAMDSIGEGLPSNPGEERPRPAYAAD